MGAYFEKLGSTSFAVYSIAVTDGQEKTWFVKRRYKDCLFKSLGSSTTTTYLIT